MRTVLLLLPAALSTLTLGAHFLRRGQLLPVAACLALTALLAVRRPWAARTVQAGLVLAVVVWVGTAREQVAIRSGAHEPWLRMAVILGGVALVAALAACAFETATLRRRFGTGPR